jgi:hypothetical protein
MQNGGGCPTIAKTKEETCYRRSPPNLLDITFLNPHNIRGFLKPRLVKVANVFVICGDEC